MIKIGFIYGTHEYDFYFLPTIHTAGIEANGIWHNFLTLDWLSYYVGISIVK